MKNRNNFGGDAEITNLQIAEPIETESLDHGNITPIRRQPRMLPQLEMLIDKVEKLEKLLEARQQIPVVHPDNHPDNQSSIVDGVVLDNQNAQAGDEDAQIGDELNDQIGDELNAQTGDELNAQVGDELNAQAGDELNAQAGDELNDQIGDELNAQIGDELNAQIGDELNGNEDDQVSNNDMGSLDNVGMTAFIAQSGANPVPMKLQQGWRDLLECNGEIPADFIYFMIMRVAQYFPTSRIQVRTTDQFFVTEMPSVLCIPCFDNKKWILNVVVANEVVIGYWNENDLHRSTTMIGNVLHVQAVNKFIETADSEAMVITLAYKLIPLIDKHTDGELVQVFQTYRLRTVFTRKKILSELNDAICEQLFFKAYWGQYFSEGENGKDELWWPCRRISKSMAKHFDSKICVGDKIPVIWYGKGSDDPICIWKIIPLSEKNEDEIIAQCNFQDDEIEELHEAYNQALKALN
jgi:hypothetical protein